MKAGEGGMSRSQSWRVIAQFYTSECEKLRLKHEEKHQGSIGFTVAKSFLEYGSRTIGQKMFDHGSRKTVMGLIQESEQEGLNELRVIATDIKAGEQEHYKCKI